MESWQYPLRPIFIRFAQEYAPSLVIAALRLVFASLILAPLALSKHRTELASLNKRDLVLAIASGTFLAFHFATWISSLEYTTVASSVVLVTTTPLWVALLSPLVLKEPITRPVIWGMLLSPSRWTGHWIFGCMPLGQWINLPLSRRIFSRTGCLGKFPGIGRRMDGCWIPIDRPQLACQDDSHSIYFRRVWNGCSCSSHHYVCFWSNQPFICPPRLTSGFFLLAIFPQLLGHSTFNWALKYLPASLVSITLLGEPIGSTILAFIILNESPISP